MVINTSPFELSISKSMLTSTESLDVSINENFINVLNLHSKPNV